MGRKLFVSRPLPSPALELIPPTITADVYEDAEPLARSGLIARLADVHGLVCQVTDIVDDDVLAAAPSLRVVANIAVGFNNIDVEAARRRGVIVTNTPDVLTDTTADFTWALLMAAARRTVEADTFVRSGRWARWDFDLLWGLDVHGKTLGVLGFGRIGRAVARRALGFDMRVLYHDTAPADPGVEQALHATFVPQATLLREADFVTIHTPLGPDTRHLIGEAVLRTMKRTAILVNAARGPIVDEPALVRALTEGWIAGAGLDVFEEEPRVHPGLPRLPNVVLAPHIGSASYDTRVAMSSLAVRNCLAVLEGKPPLTPVP